MLFSCRYGRACGLCLNDQDLGRDVRKGVGIVVAVGPFPFSCASFSTASLC